MSIDACAKCAPRHSPVGGQPAHYALIESSLEYPRIEEITWTGFIYALRWHAHVSD